MNVFLPAYTPIVLTCPSPSTMTSALQWEGENGLYLPAKRITMKVLCRSISNSSYYYNVCVYKYLRVRENSCGVFLFRQHVWQQFIATHQFTVEATQWSSVCRLLMLIKVDYDTWWMTKETRRQERSLIQSIVLYMTHTTQSWNIYIYKSTPSSKYIVLTDNFAHYL